MLEHFPNLFIGVTGSWLSFFVGSLTLISSTGVITYSSNLNTSAVVRQMVTAATPDAQASSPETLRIVLETDAPFMIPGNLYTSLPEIKGRRLPLCHTAMLPWTAEFVARVANEVGGSWDIESVMKVARENARKMYGI